MTTILLTAVLIWNFGLMFQARHDRRDIEWNERCFDHQCAEIAKLKIRLAELQDKYDGKRII